MGTVLVIGNGFDLNLGLKTSYKDFFESESFIKNSGEAQTVELNMYYIERYFGPVKNISVFNYLRAYRYLTNWCDIEGALGELVTYAPRDKHSGFVITEDSFKRLHSCFCDYLNKYVLNDSFNLNTNSVAFALANTLVYKSNLSILNFNYTPSLERISPFFEGKVKYIHGNVKDNSIIFGVEDELNVPKEYSFLLKTFSTNYRGHSIQNQLLTADRIIIFGHSLAKADYHYFKGLFMRQTNPKDAIPQQRISIFTKDEKSMRDVLWQIRKMNENRSDYLFDLCHFEIFRTDNDQDRINTFLQKLKDEQSDIIAFNPCSLDY